MQTMAVLRRYAETPFRLTRPAARPGPARAAASCLVFGRGESRPDAAQAPFMKEPSPCRLTI